MKIKVLKDLLKKIVVYIVVFMILLSDLSLPASAYTSAEIGQAVAGYARHVVSNYGVPGSKIVKYRQGKGGIYDHPGDDSNPDYVDCGGAPGHSRIDNPIWNFNNYSWSSQYVYFDCSSFASGCWHQVVPQIFSGGPPSSYNLSVNFSYSSIFERHEYHTKDTLQVGDIMAYNGKVDGQDKGHAWIYIGGSQDTECANMGRKTPAEGGLQFKTISDASKGSRGNSNSLIVYHLTLKPEYASQITEINTEMCEGGFGSTTSGITGDGQDFSNFFFNGIPDGKYSVASRKSIFALIIEALAAILNFLIGLITYLIRGLIISFISIFDRELNTTIKAINEVDVEVNLENMGLSSTSADDPHSGNRVITIEELVFDQIDLFDVNIFK